MYRSLSTALAWSCNHVYTRDAWHRARGIASAAHPSTAEWPAESFKAAQGISDAYHRFACACTEPSTCDVFGDPEPDLKKGFPLSAILLLHLTDLPCHGMQLSH